MELPLQITFRHMEPSPAIEARITEHAQKLDRYHDRITSCRVVIEAPHKHHHKGRLYHVAVELGVPDGRLVASRERDLHHAHEDVYVAIRDAFDAVRRQLDGYVTRRRGEVKMHEPGLRGRIVEIVRERDFGRIETTDGRSIYFHRNSVVGAKFDALAVGTEVRLVETAGAEGPQASTVHVLAKTQSET
jgi:ribosomal subunit interface protein